MYFPRVLEKWVFSESEFVSNSTEPRVQFGVDTFSGLSEPSSGRTLFFVEIHGLADVGELGSFRFRRVGRDKVAREASRSVSRACPGTENEGCAFRHLVGVA